MTDSISSQIEQCVRLDPARRGLIGSEPRFGPLCQGHLAAAAEHLATAARDVVIVTGFFIPRGDPPAAETDGPPGALLLAETLRQTGASVTLVTDRFCRDALRAAAREFGFPSDCLASPPDSAEASPTGEAAWRGQLFEDHPHLTHLVAIERVGPSHTLESMLRQSREGVPPTEQFLRQVPPEHQNHCHNMRGEAIDQFAGDIHRLFEEAQVQSPNATTVGIGDGANEIGMGCIPWEELERRLTGEQSGRVPCRISCRWNLVAGTSNWGAMALAAAIAHRRGACEVLAPFTVDQQQRVLQAMIDHGPAVDGVTRRREPTVDGLSAEEYFQPWRAIRRLLALPE
ncbi:MAG: glutamate cyclase domain-containing protein [Planctomycetales bacterium]